MIPTFPQRVRAFVVLLVLAPFYVVLLGVVLFLALIVLIRDGWRAWQARRQVRATLARLHDETYREWHGERP